MRCSLNASNAPSSHPPPAPVMTWLHLLHGINAIMSMTPWPQPVLPNLQQEQQPVPQP